MKQINQFITEYIIKKKLDKPINSETTNYLYHPETKPELSKIIRKLLKDNQTDLNVIDVSKITNMSDLFSQINENKKITNIDISEWDVSNVKHMDEMFVNCSKFKGKGLENWDISNIEPTNMFDMFNNCQSLKKPSWYKGNI